MNRRRLVALGALLSAALSSPALACGDGKTLMEDNLSKLSPAWGFDLDTNVEKVGEGGYVAAFPPNHYRRGVSQASLYTDYEVCGSYRVTFTCTDPSACESSPTTGVAFWGADFNNVYVFSVAPAYSTFSLWRMQNAKWLTPIRWTALPDGKKLASGQPFEIGVAVQGQHAAFSVDGAVVAEFDGIPPEGGSLIGFEVSTGASDKAPSELTVSKISVHELPAKP